MSLESRECKQGFQGHPRHPSAPMYLLRRRERFPWNKWSFFVMPWWNLYDLKPLRPHGQPPWIAVQRNGILSNTRDDKWMSRLSHMSQHPSSYWSLCLECNSSSSSFALDLGIIYCTALRHFSISLWSCRGNGLKWVFLSAAILRVEVSDKILVWVETRNCCLGQRYNPTSASLPRSNGLSYHGNWQLTKYR